MCKPGKKLNMHQTLHVLKDALKSSSHMIRHQQLRGGRKKIVRLLPG